LTQGYCIETQSLGRGFEPHPRLYDSETGEVIRQWPDLPTVTPRTQTGVGLVLRHRGGVFRVAWMAPRDGGFQ
jgi:hypothetical protein